MKKLLFQLDTDPIPSSFDTVVAYDGGADHVMAYGGMTPANISSIVDGTIFTRSPKEKQYTAIFVGGGNLADGQQLLDSVRRRFFADFRVSIMLDSNGSNTTAAAGVAYMAKNRTVAGKQAVVLAGTGPVGQRAAALLAKEGAHVTITSRRLERAQAACDLMMRRFGVTLSAIEAPDETSRAAAIKNAQIVFAAGAAGVRLLAVGGWRDNASIEVMVDANAQPPLGIEGVEMMDRNTERHGKIVCGAIGFGALKLKVHRACIAKLFERADQVLDAEEIYSIAKAMA